MTITVFRARKVHTMERSCPTADAVAVRDGRIVEVGDFDDMGPWLDRHDHVIDDRFADAVLVPGLIDPHVHPALMAFLLAAHWVTGEHWEIPGRTMRQANDRDEFLAHVRDLHDSEPADEPLVVFGWLAQFHGEIVRADLDEISSERAIVIWQRSFHELRANTPGLQWLDAPAGAEWDPHIELDTGQMFESGMVWALQVAGPWALDPARFDENLGVVADLAGRAGVTTIADAGVGIFDLDLEQAAYERVLGADSVGFRTVLLANIGRAKAGWKLPTSELVEKLDQLATDHPTSADADGPLLSWRRASKHFADGAFIAQLMQVGDPGFIDGHQGAWLATPEQLLRQVRPYWDAGFDVHIHVNGDVGVDACLDAIATLQSERPRLDHRTTLHHFGVSTAAQIRRLAALGVHVSANGYYLRQFGDAFTDRWLGQERASQMTRVGSVKAAGATVSAHSDLPMGPLLPLEAVTNLATRRTASGRIAAPAEQLSVHDALASVTIDAAYQLRLDHLIGSLAAGKSADLCALAEDPFEVEPGKIDQIEIIATVFRGEVVQDVPPS